MRRIELELGLFITAAELEYIQLALFIAKQALCLHLDFRVLNCINLTNVFPDSACLVTCQL